MLFLKRPNATKEPCSDKDCMIGVANGCKWLMIKTKKGGAIMKKDLSTSNCQNEKTWRGKNTLKNKLFFIAILTTLILLAVSAWEPAIAQPKRGGILRTATYFDPPHWDPHATLSYQVHFATSFIYSKLLRVKQGEDVDPYAMEIEGDLAESWKQVSPTEYVFKLHRGVHFHNKPPVNGRELTSADVKYSFERILSPETKSPIRAVLGIVQSIETPDRYTVKITTKEPYSPFLKFIAVNFVCIVPREVVEKYGDLRKWDLAVGTGPFTVESYEPGVRIVFKRNPDYFEKGRPYLDKVDIRIIKSSEVMNMALKNEELDLGMGNPFPDFQSTEEMLKIHPNMKRSRYHINAWPHIALASDKPPFNDKRVRQAVSMSLNRQKILEILADGNGWIDNILAMAMEGSIPYKKLGTAAMFFEYNPAEAKRLIREAGLRPPLKVKLIYTPAYGPVWVSFVEVIAAQMKAAGTFDVTLVPQEYGKFDSSTRRGRYNDDGLFAFQLPTVDAGDALWGNFHSTAFLNAARVKDKITDNLLEAQRREVDPSKRTKILDKLQFYLADQMFDIPLVSTAQFDMWFPYVRGYNSHVVPSYNTGDSFSQVWLDK